MNYLNLDKNGYILSISKTPIVNGVECKCDLTQFDFSGYRLMAYKWTGETLIFDEDKFAKLSIDIQKEKEKLNAPSQLDIIEAQITYTAMMTDTLLGG